MERIPEPELMEDPDQVLAYAEADFGEANRLFIDLFVSYFPDFIPQTVLDLGCGPGEITLRFAEHFPDSKVTGLDGSAAMLARAKDNLRRRPDLQHRVHWRRARLPVDPAAGGFDAVISNSLLHHLAAPEVLWQEVKRQANRGGVVLIMDLIRPRSPAAARQQVEVYARDAPEILRRDFLNSLHASYRPEEVRNQLDQAGLTDFSIEIVSDRHWAVHGVMQ